MQITRLLMLIFLFIFATQACVCMADYEQSRNPYLLGVILSGRTMEEFETYLKKQYETKFVFNDVETSFVRRQASFGKHVKTLIKGSTLGNI